MKNFRQGIFLLYYRKQMKVLTTNFVQCPVKSCGGFPLVYRDCELMQLERAETVDYTLFAALLDRIEWPALVSVMGDLGNSGFPPTRPEEMEQEMLESLHGLLVETEIHNGEMCCKSCGHVMHVKNSVANFLLPPHLAN